MKIRRGTPRPVLHLRHVDDENEVVCYDRYVYADTGIVCRLLGDAVEITRITGKEITFTFAHGKGKEVQLHPGESYQFVAEIPGLIADGSGWQQETLHVTWIPEEQTEGLTVGTMRKAIGIRLKKVDAPSKIWTSRFFGMPAFSEKDLEKVRSDSGMFLAQINLHEARRFDSADILPKGQYLYLFLHKNPEGCSDGSVIRSWGGAEQCIADFNEKADVFSNATDVWEAEFFEAEGDYPGTKLMGVPNGWPSWESAPQLLLQFNAKDAPGVTGLPGDEGIGWMFFVGSMEKPEESCWFSKTM